MNHLTLGIYYPKPECRQDFLDGCQKVAEVARLQPGLLDTGAWYDPEEERIIILSLWESEEAAMAARPDIDQIVAAFPFATWGRKPPERMPDLMRAV